MTSFILLPGIYGSGETHWQSFWEREHRNMRRFQPTSWDKPDLGDWISALDRSVVNCEGPCILVAHSLACLLVAHWSQATRQKIAGAFLVSVPDPASAAFPVDAAGFSKPPEKPFGFPSLIVASTTDPFGTIAYMRERAAQWGSDFAIAGPLGHINGASALQNWPQGRKMLDDFVDGRTAAADGTSGYPT